MKLERCVDSDDKDVLTHEHCYDGWDREMFVEQSDSSVRRASDGWCMVKNENITDPKRSFTWYLKKGVGKVLLDTGHKLSLIHI